jgi:hypothetical protein
MVSSAIGSSTYENICPPIGCIELQNGLNKGHGFASSWRSIYQVWWNPSAAKYHPDCISLLSVYVRIQGFKWNLLDTSITGLGGKQNVRSNKFCLVDRLVLPSHVQSIICEASVILIPVMVSVVKRIIKFQKYLISFNLVNEALKKNKS